MFNYCVAYDDGGYLIRYGIGEPIQRYNESNRKWEDDDSLCQIFFGGIPVNVITEEEANALINK